MRVWSLPTGLGKNILYIERHYIGHYGFYSRASDMGNWDEWPKL